MLDKVIKVVRESKGRTDAAEQLQKKFKLSEKQAFFIVDLRIYQLSRTSVEEVAAELKEKRARVKAINKILKSEKALKGEVATDLQRISDTYGDDRRSEVLGEYDEPEFDKEAFIEHEDAHVIVTTDGWIKRIRTSNDPETTRMREGDSLFFTEEASTKDTLVLFTNRGNTFGTQIIDLVSTTGYGEPVQKTFRFGDGEVVVACMVVPKDGANGEILLYSKQGYGFRYEVSALGVTKKNGKRVMRVSEKDQLAGLCPVDEKLLLLISEQGYCTCFVHSEAPLLANGGKGVILQKMSGGDKQAAAVSVNKKGKVLVTVESGKPKEIDVAALTIASRAKRGLKLIKRGMPVLGVLAVRDKKGGKAKNLSLF